MTNTNGWPNGDYENNDYRNHVPSAEPRQPQLNLRICSCKCTFCGLVAGGAEADRSGGGDDTDQNWLAGDEGVESHMLTTQPAQAGLREHHEPFMVNTEYARFEHGREGFVMAEFREVGATIDEAEDYALGRVDSEESMAMHADSSGGASMSSSIHQAAGPQNNAQLIVGAGTQFSGSNHNATRSAYFFVSSTPTPVAPVRCGCHSQTDPESGDSSSADLCAASSDFSESATDDDFSY